MSRLTEAHKASHDIAANIVHLHTFAVTEGGNVAEVDREALIAEIDAALSIEDVAREELLRRVEELEAAAKPSGYGRKAPTARQLAEHIAEMATNDRAALIQRVAEVIIADRAFVREKWEQKVAEVTDGLKRVLNYLDERTSDCVDNDGAPHQSQGLADAIARAKELLS